ncbi:hypothetical protein ACFB49_13170 [Sphingomonas sp. DBB INV C78]|uniref:hypothetical protein n=1 Tax=Sphingomonas sp. DBB INV C78 TaxID=3349434 RepID=UPI0036D3900B
MSEAAPIPVTLNPEDLAALDAWIDRHDDPRPSRAEAIRLVLAGALGTHMPSSPLPKLVTGKDIV